MRSSRAGRTAQAWMETLADDPEALSALAVAQARLPAARDLVGVRKLRLLELSGELPDAVALESLLHCSTQFYNPHKERCIVRREAGQAAPPREDEAWVLVTERSGGRRAAAERWWLGETGQEVQVREGVVWTLRFSLGVPVLERATELAIARDLRHGLLCNPHSQEAKVTMAPVPFPWIGSRSHAQKGAERP